MKKFTFLKTVFSAALALVISSSTNAQTLVAHYKFDNNLNDETTNWNLTQSADFTGLSYVTGIDGTPNGAVTGFTAPDYLETATNFSISSNDTRTMMAWIKLDATSGFNAVAGLGQVANYKKWSFGVTGTKVRIEMQGKGFTAGNFGDLSAGTWYHIAVVYNNTDNKIQLFVNGQGYNSNTWSETNTTATPLRIGNDFNNTNPPQSRGFEGALDDVRIYSDALTESEILTIYNLPTLSSSEIETTSFNVYPNPVVDILNFSSSDVKSVDIYSIIGAKVATLETSNNSVDLSAYSSGMYVVNCKNSKQQTIKTIKIVKK